MQKFDKYLNRYFFWIVCIVTVLCILICALMFLPGGYTPDSAYQLYQAMGKADLSTWHPVGTALYWRLLLFLSNGEIASIALMRITAFWLGMLLLARFIYLKTNSKYLVWLPIIIGMLPNVLLVLHFNWKDSEMASYLLLALGVILNVEFVNITANWKKIFKTILLFISLLLIAYVLTVRTNAIIAVFPILVLWFDQIFSSKLRKRSQIFYYLGVVIVAIIIASISNSLLSWRFQATQSNANATMYALHIVNILPKEEVNRLDISPDTKKLLLKFSSGNCSRFNGGWNVILWDKNCIPGEIWDTTIEKIEVSKELQTVWTNTIIKNPIQFISYSMVTYANWLTSGTPVESYGGSFHLTDRTLTPMFSFGQRFFQIYNNNFGNKWLAILYEKWFYLILNCILLVIVLKNKHLHNRRIILSLIASGLLFMLSFTPATLTSDYRYIFWTIISSLLALALILCEIDWAKASKVISFKK